MSSRCLRVGILGHGAIGSVVARAIVASSHGLVSPARVRLVAVLVQRPRDAPEELAGSGVLFTADASKFHAAEWDVCVEAAGQGAVREHAVRVLDRGRDFLCTVRE